MALKNKDFRFRYALHSFAQFTIFHTIVKLKTLDIN